MSCEHSETTTLLWLYGELDADRQDSHLRHVADCADCTAVVAEHEQVAVAVAPIAPALRRVEPPRAANRPFMAAAFVVLAVAAAAIFAILLPDREVAPLDTDIAVALESDLGVVDPPLFGDVDDDLDALDWALADLSHDLGTL